MDKSKNTLIGVLICVILVLCCVIAFTLGAKSNNNDDDTNVEETVKSYIEESEGIPYITLTGFESQNTEIKDFYGSNKDSVYVYHVYNNILFLNVENSSLVTPLEGKVTYLNYYIDLSNNKILSANDVLEKLNVNMSDFNLQCIECSLSTLDNNVRLIPVGGLLYVEALEMGTFNSFRVSYNK